MAINDDWESTTRIWKNLSFPMKVFLGLTLLANLLAGFSLLSHVTALAGFIIEAYKFYRSLTEPVRNLVEGFIVISRTKFDILVVALTIQGAILRGRALSQHKDYVMLAFAVPSLLVWVLAATLYRMYNQEWMATFETVAFILFVSFAIFTPMVIGWFPKADRNNPLYLQERLATGYVVGLAILVAAIAAVSKGLQQGFGIG